MTINSHVNWIAGVIIRQVIIQPARVLDYSTMIESHWLFIRVVIRVQSTNSHDGLFVRLIIQQWFDNDCLITQLAWLIIRQWLSHIDYSPARVIDYSTMIEPHWLIESHWLFIRVVNRVQSTNSHEWLFGWLIISTMIRQSLINQPARIIRQLAWLIIRQRLSHIDYSLE